MRTTKLQLPLLALFLGCVFLQAQYRRANPLNQDIYVVRGQAWQSELKGSCTRLSLRARDKIRRPLWDLAQQSAGLSVAPRSNAPEIKIRYIVEDGLSIPRTPAAGISGVDLYAVDSNGRERRCAGRYSVGDAITYNFSEPSYAAKSDNGFEYQLSLLLYNKVS